MEQCKQWDEIRRIADRLDSPHADKVFVAQEYTKADLRRDLLATIPTHTSNDLGELLDRHSRELTDWWEAYLGRRASM